MTGTGAALFFVFGALERPFHIDKLADSSDAVSRDLACIHRCHVLPGRTLDVCRRMLPARGDWAETMRDPLLYECAVDVATFPVADERAVGNSDYRSVLHQSASFLFLRTDSM